MFLIGYDIGSSSVKAALVDASSGKAINIVQSPEKEMPIDAPENGWGEQSPGMWWENVCKATQILLHSSQVVAEQIKGIGISYQMHGLVVVDRQLEVLRPSIIWCDSRAVGIGEALYQNCGEIHCNEHLLNSPGNFTLSKLKWVKDNEPDTFRKIHKIMLPGDYIAMKLSGECTTTASGLSEGIMWDFKENVPAYWLLEQAGISSELLSEIVPTFGKQVVVNTTGAQESGLPEGIPIWYRAGDQPNNALSLNVLEPGQIAATGGTSGVVYAVSDKVGTLEPSRINNFVHVSHTPEKPRIGKLLCINGTGILYNWMRQMTGDRPYSEMNQMASSVPVGSDGLQILPFGNGAERMLKNSNRGAQVSGLNFNLHSQGHLYRAALEGIAFSFVYGMEILRRDGVNLKSIKAGNDNLFRAATFSKTIATLTNTEIEIVETTGAVGAARAAGVAAGYFNTFEEAVRSDEIQHIYIPEKNPDAYLDAYKDWEKTLIHYNTTEAI